MNRFCGLIYKQKATHSGVLKDSSFRFKKEIVKNKIYLWSEIEVKEDNAVFNGLVYRDQSIIQPENAHSYILKEAQHLSGSWAFAQVDLRNETLTLSRDRIGGRSLFFIDNESFFAFATDIKTLIAFGFLKPKLNRKVVFDYFAKSDFDALNEKLFLGLLELGPGLQLKYSLKTHDFKTKHYVQPSYNSNIERFDQENSVRYQEQIRSELDQLFEVLLNRKEINASLLSGGLDSSLIALYTSKSRPDWHYFTAGFDGGNIDESQEANQLVRHLGLQNWNVVKPDEAGFIGALKDLTKTIELPTFSAGTYVQYALMQKISELGIKEILDGTGADALFAGHHYHYTFLWKEMIRKFRFKPLFAEQSKSSIISNPYKYLIKNDIKYNRLPFLSANNQWRQKLRLYPELRFLKRDLAEEYKSNLAAQVGSKVNTLNSLLYREYYEGGVRKLLRYINRCGERFGVSVHFPFVYSSKLIELMFSIPGAYKIHDGKLKYLIREAYKDQWPQRLYEGTAKKGLLSPNNQWIRKHKDAFKPYLLELNKDVFDVALMEKEFDLYFNPKSDLENYRIFKFISFALWRESFNV